MSFRKITVDEEVWEWMCGQKNVVIKHPDSNEKSIVSITSLTGLSEEQFAAGKCCRAVNNGDCVLGTPSCVCNQGMITPQMISDYIRSTLQ